jgi:hypothetical protein
MTGLRCDVKDFDPRLDAERKGRSGRLQRLQPGARRTSSVVRRSPRRPIADAADFEVDEDALARVGEISEVNISTSEPLDIGLSSGHYVFFCNLEGHYLGGMRFAFEVSDDG